MSSKSSKSRDKKKTDNSITDGAEQWVQFVNGLPKGDEKDDLLEFSSREVARNSIGVMIVCFVVVSVFVFA